MAPTQPLCYHPHASLLFKRSEVHMMHLSRTGKVREVRGRVFKFPDLGHKRPYQLWKWWWQRPGNTTVTPTPYFLLHDRHTQSTETLLLSLLRILKTALQETAVNKSKLKQTMKPICHMVLAKSEVQTVEVRFIPTPPFFSHLDTWENWIQEKWS